MIKTVENLEWRYATKRFDPNKDVTATELNVIRKAGTLSATSYGLQLFQVLEIPRGAIRSDLRATCWNQAQIEEAHTVFVLCIPDHLPKADIEASVADKAELQGLPDAAKDGYRNFIIEKLSTLSPSELENWMAKQTYIVLADMMMACAEQHVDSCPMEGFEKDALSKVLGLKDKGLIPTVLLTLGHRSEEDITSERPKYRKSTEALFSEHR